MSKTFLMAGGGTGGHVIPALAVARELRRRGHEVFFVGTERGLEGRLVPAEGFELQMIHIGGLNRVGMRQMASTLMRLPFTTLACGRLVRRSAAVFSMGGYVAGPPVMAALLRRRPVVVMEPNAVPGFTNRVIGRFVARALVSFPETAAYFPPAAPRSPACRCARSSSGSRRSRAGAVLEILITGGSQGSRTLNQAARESWPLFRKSGIPVRIVHQTGAGGFRIDRARASRNPAWRARWCLSSPICPRRLPRPTWWCAAPARARFRSWPPPGKPSILVPFPFAADDHQTRNAEAMERGGAARLVRDAEMNGETVVRGCVGAGRVRPARWSAWRRRRGSSPGPARRRAPPNFGGGRSEIRFLLTARASRNNTIRKCFFVPSTCISRGSAASA